MSTVCNKCGKHWAFMGQESGQCIYCLGLVEGSAGLGDMPDPDAPEVNRDKARRFAALTNEFADTRLLLEASSLAENQETAVGDGRDINPENEEIPEWARPYIRQLKEQVDKAQNACITLSLKLGDAEIKIEAAEGICRNLRLLLMEVRGASLQTLPDGRIDHVHCLICSHQDGHGDDCIIGNIDAFLAATA